MYPLGHIGISLALYAPVAYVLGVRDRRKEMLTGLVFLLFLTITPDLDALVAGLAHRGVTHSLTAALLLGLACSVGGWASGLFDADLRRSRALFGGFLGKLGVMSHLAGDVITPWGVRPFLPFDAELYRFTLTRAADPVANRALFAVGAALLILALHSAQIRSGSTADPSPEPSVDTPVEPR